MAGASTGRGRAAALRPWPRPGATSPPRRGPCGQPSLLLRCALCQNCGCGLRAGRTTCMPFKRVCGPGLAPQRFSSFIHSLIYLLRQRAVSGILIVCALSWASAGMASYTLRRRRRDSTSSSPPPPPPLSAGPAPAAAAEPPAKRPRLSSPPAAAAAASDAVVHEAPPSPDISVSCDDSAADEAANARFRALESRLAVLEAALGQVPHWQTKKERKKERKKKMITKGED